MKVGRNAPCPCGSGKKYKVCCARKTAKRNDAISKSAVAFLGVLMFVLVAAIAASFYGFNRSTDATRVWNSEHGHWHDANGQRIP